MAKKRVIRRRRRARRNPAQVSTKKYRKGYAKAFGGGKKRKHKKAKKSTSTKRKAAARKAAKTRAAKHALRSRAAKKAARTRKRHMRAGKVTVTHRKRHRKVKKHLRKHRGKIVKTIVLRRKPSSKRRAVHRVRRHVARIRDRKGRTHRAYSYSVSRNPLGAMKGMLLDGAMIYGGLKAVGIINNLLNQYVVSRFSAQLPTQVAPLVAPALGFVAAAFAGKAIKGQPKLVGALQTGATIALLDTLVKKVVAPMLPASVQNLLAGIDDMGYRGYGEYVRPLGEYVQGPRRQLGAYVSEAMALDEYVQDRGMGGFNVQEALADSEVQGMQSGYAAGSLAKTAFSI